MAECRALFFSCEHGGNLVPPEYQSLFLDQTEGLNTHRGYDPGALSLARTLARGMAAPLEKSETTRLLVDLNRSLKSKTLFSKATRGLGPVEKNRILECYYLPYRTAVTRKIEDLIADGAQVVHLSIHTFTPNLDGQQRNAELGLLYDPARSAEKQFCCSWLELLQPRIPELRIRCNYPYRGTADGLVRSLRHRFSYQDYLGLELEVNQALLNGHKSFPPFLAGSLLETLKINLSSD